MNEPTMKVRVTAVLTLKGSEPFGKHPEFLNIADIAMGLDRILAASPYIAPKGVYIEKFEKLEAEK